MYPFSKVSIFSLVTLGGVVVGLGCESSDESVHCGSGTELVGTNCVPITRTTASTDGDAGAVTPAVTAPTFEGVSGVAPASPTSILVAWNEARGSSSPDRMRYRIFVADTGSPIDYTRPLATTAPGARSFYL